MQSLVELAPTAESCGRGSTRCATLPRVNLPEALREVCAWAGADQAFASVTGGEVRLNPALEQSSEVPARYPEGGLGALRARYRSNASRASGMNWERWTIASSPGSVSQSNQPTSLVSG